MKLKKRTAAFAAVPRNNAQFTKVYYGLTDAPDPTRYTPNQEAIKSTIAKQAIINRTHDHPVLEGKNMAPKCQINEE
jgi:hypothetical protein